jgi:hypothetical protein
LEPSLKVPDAMAADEYEYEYENKMESASSVESMTPYEYEYDDPHEKSDVEYELVPHTLVSSPQHHRPSAWVIEAWDMSWVIEAWDMSSSNALSEEHSDKSMCELYMLM